MNQYSNSASREVFNIVGRGLRWSKECIIRFVDDVAAATIRTPRDSALFFVQDHRTDLYRPDKKRTMELVSSSLGPARLALAEMREKLDTNIKRAMRIRFASDKSVTKQITLPAATQDVLPAIVRNKVESIAPWPLDRAIWGYRTAPMTDESGQLCVTIKILSRETVTQLIDDLKGSGVSVSAVDIGDSPTESETVDLDLKNDRHKTVSRRIAAAIASVFCLLAFGYAAYGVLKGWNVQQNVVEIESRILELKGVIVGEKEGSRTSVKLVGANTLYLQKRSSPPLVTVLASVTELIPDNIWLTQVKIESGKLTIAGHGKDIPQLIETLESSVRFKDANFASATQRDDDIDSERFSISAFIRSMEPGE